MNDERKLSQYEISEMGNVATKFNEIYNEFKGLVSIGSCLAKPEVHLTASAFMHTFGDKYSVGMREDAAKQDPHYRRCVVNGVRFFALLTSKEVAMYDDAWVRKHFGDKEVTYR